jgi:hypothetical protein
MGHANEQATQSQPNAQPAKRAYHTPAPLQTIGKLQTVTLGSGFYSSTDVSTFSATTPG